MNSEKINETSGGVRTNVSRRLPIGAEPGPDGVHFRVWAPNASEVQVVFEGDRAPSPVKLEAAENGYFAGLASEAEAGALYRFRLDGAASLVPDPASRFQPQGPHGPSEVIDPHSFSWTDSKWRGISSPEQVLYEMHIGTFTPAGTWAAAVKKLPLLADMGITCLEVMPVADFPGRFGWGYDGVNLFAPTRLYGRPDDFRRFIDTAHGLGLAVILDVVYNHLGPDGNYLKSFSKQYFSERHHTDWGEAINFDGPGSRAVREFYLSNAEYWIAEYHLDGFRFDATQNIYDDSVDHILAAITRQARRAAGSRGLYLIAENEPQHTRIVRSPDAGGFGMDALWNDDFHHSALVRLSGRNESYFTGYLGRAQEFVSAARWGYLYQGQRYAWQKNRRGTPALDLPHSAFINFIENHDQLANVGHGERTARVASPSQHRAMTALLLLSPQSPMLFQGQEFGASSPFHYFADHTPELAKLVRKGRAEFHCQFPSTARPEMRQCLPDPGDPAVFERCRLDWDEWDRNIHARALHRDLLQLRHHDPVLSRRPARIEGVCFGDDALMIRYFGPDGDDRLLLINFGVDLRLVPSPEPLLAPPLDRRWEILWSSENPQYGGCGTVPPESDDGWLIPGHAAVVLRPVPMKDESE